ncbi:hypothetical protein PAMA_012363 [Pampus argenteus]
MPPFRALCFSTRLLIEMTKAITMTLLAKRPSLDLRLAPVKDVQQASMLPTLLVENKLLVSQRRAGGPWTQKCVRCGAPMRVAGRFHPHGQRRAS